MCSQAEEDKKKDPQQAGTAPTPSPGPGLPPIPPLPEAGAGASGAAAETGAAASAGGASAAVVVGLVALDVGLAIYDSSQGYKLYQSYKLSKDRSTVEPTPTTNRNIYEPVGGTPAKRNKITGETWERDKSRHGGEHYEVYKNMRDFKNRKRDRAVWQDGRLKEKF